MAATTTARAAETLATELPAPTWGEQIGRLRKSRYKNASDLSEELATYGVKTTASTISRIEALEAVPDDASRRIIAATVMVLCDFHPARLGISLDELPLNVYGALFGAPDDPSGLEVSPRACNAGRLPPRARKARSVPVAA